jgi:hypothetical protein
MAGYQVGRLSRLLVSEESTYGTAATLLATHAMRHLEFTDQYSPFNRVNSPEKKQSPGVMNRFDRRVTAGFNLSSAYMRPSGVVATAPECNLLFKHGMGTVRLGTGNTTFASALSTTGGTVQAAQGATFQVGEGIVITIASGGNAGVYVRVITAIASDALSWAPALPGAPAVADTVKAAVTYRLASTIANSVTFSRYLPDISFQILGGVVDKLKVMFGNNDEPKFSASGPAQKRLRPSPAIPGFTTVGGNPPSGLTGGLLIGSQAHKFLALNIEVDNGLQLQNEDFGSTLASGFYQPGRRNITFGLNTRVTDLTAAAQNVAYTNAEGGTDFTLFAQCGSVAGNIVAIYSPRAEFVDPPDTPDGDGALQWSYKGILKETVSGSGNDELTVIFS